jgi:tetratricopeptide (TPR) repeat protein
LAKYGKKRGHIPVKEMKFRNDPMIHLYEKTQEWLQESGRPVMMGAAVVAIVVVLYLIGSAVFSWRQSNAAAAFAQAFEKYNAQVVDSTVTTTPTGKTYSDERVKWQETAEAFEQLANDYGSYYGEIGRYYAGVAYLRFDRDKGVKLLQSVVDAGDRKTSDLAQTALAENYVAVGEADKAVPLLEKLLESNNLPKQGIRLSLARAYEKSGNVEKAVENYFEVAKADREGPTGSEAERRLNALAPEKVKELPTPASALPPNLR